MKAYNTAERCADFIELKDRKLSSKECLALIKTVTNISKQKNKRIVIGMNSCSDVDNLFIETLLSCQKHCDKNSTSISLYGMNSETICLFCLLKLDSQFEIYDNRQDAVSRKNRLIKRRLKAV